MRRKLVVYCEQCGGTEPSGTHDFVVFHCLSFCSPDCHDDYRTRRRGAPRGAARGGRTRDRRRRDAARQGRAQTQARPRGLTGPTHTSEPPQPRSRLARLPVFYGWIIVAVGFATMAMGVNARTSFSLLFPEVLNEFQFDRGVAAGIFSFGFFVSAFVAPFVGRLMDRRGPILVVEVGVAMIVLGLGLAAIAREPWQIYVTLGIMVGSGANFLGYSVQSQFIPNWFVRRRGLALGIAFSGVGLGSIILLPWLQIMIARDGWRWACLVFAVITAVLLFPLNLLLRKRPADIGLRADGDAAPVAGSRAAREQHRGPGVGVGHLDAVARDAHRAVLVDRARLLRDPLRVVRRAGAPDQIPDRDRRLADGSRVGARHRQPRRRAGADHLRPRVRPHRARMGVDDRLRRFRDLLCGAARAAGRDDAGAALRA